MSDIRLWGKADDLIHREPIVRHILISGTRPDGRSIPAYALTVTPLLALVPELARYRYWIELATDEKT